VSYFIKFDQSSTCAINGVHNTQRNDVTAINVKEQKNSTEGQKSTTIAAEMKTGVSSMQQSDPEYHIHRNL